MVYIDERLYKLFADINATNNAIISQVEQGLDDIKIYYPEGLNPTRKNVLDTDHVEAISGGTNYYPFYPDNDTIDDISNLLSVFSETEPYYQVSLRLIKEVLLEFGDLRIVTLVLVITIQTIDFECLIAQHRLKVINVRMC